MTDRELRKLDKAELLELLIDLSDENETLRKKNAQLRSRLEAMRDEMPPRELLNQEIGSIAEAAISVNGVFEAAQAAADQYLSAIRALYETKKEEYHRILNDASLRAGEIIREAERTGARKMAEADAYYRSRMENIASGIETPEAYGRNDD